MKQIDINLNNWNPAILQAENNDSTSERMLRVPSSAFGSLRRELINTIGFDRAKGFLRRYGWDCGVTDAKKLMKMNWENEEDLILAGPKMHALNKHVEVEPVVCKYDFETKSLHFEGEWISSYEAIEHQKLFTHTHDPICHTLVGYASGYLSTLMEKKVIVKETKCMAMGDSNCHWIAKTIDLWNDDENIELENRYYVTSNIGDELEETYEKLRVERDNLSKTYQVHQILVKELLYETGLKSIVNILHDTTKIPVMIENVNFENYVVMGISLAEADQLSKELKQWYSMQKNKRFGRKELSETIFVEISKEHKRLITPIYFHQNVFAYCSFLLKENTFRDVDKMVLEQAALACSLQLLNERTRFNTEQRMRGSFLEDILEKRITIPEIVKRAHYIDFQLSNQYFMIAINLHTEETTLFEEIELNDRLMNDILSFIKNNGVSTLIAQKTENIIILVSQATIEQNGYKKEIFSRKLLDYCSKLYPKFFFRMGISSSLSSIEESSSLYDESLSALKVTNRHQDLVFFDSLGLIGMLLETKNTDTIKKFAYKVLGKLIEEDKNKNMELTKTLYHYLENGSNVHKTARAMNFSISGLRYRLGRLNEILQTDINSPYIKHEIFLALQSLIVLGELDID